MNKTEKVKNFFDETHLYLHKDFGVKVRKEIANDLLYDIAFNKKIIDLGCGNGHVSLQFLDRAHSVDFLDISKKMLSLVEVPRIYKEKVNFFNTNIDEFEVNDKYDIAIAFGLIMHVNSPDLTIKKINNLLNLNGKVLIQFTNKNHFISRFNNLTANTSYKVNKFDPISFEGLIKNHGFIINKKSKYSLMIKGLGLLPNYILHKIHLLTYKNKTLSSIGMDYVYLLEKIRHVH